MIESMSQEQFLEVIDRDKAERRFRGKVIAIEVKNPVRVCRGVRSPILNGRALDGNLVPADQLEEQNRVEVVLG